MLRVGGGTEEEVFGGKNTKSAKSRKDGFERSTVGFPRPLKMNPMSVWTLCQGGRGGLTEENGERCKSPQS